MKEPIVPLVGSAVLVEQENGVPTWGVWDEDEKGDLSRGRPGRSDPDMSLPDLLGFASKGNHSDHLHLRLSHDGGAQKDCFPFKQPTSGSIKKSSLRRGRQEVASFKIWRKQLRGDPNVGHSYCIPFLPKNGCPSIHFSCRASCPWRDPKCAFVSPCPRRPRPAVVVVFGVSCIGSGSISLLLWCFLGQPFSNVINHTYYDPPDGGVP